jgi:hypothetical protein
LKDLLVLGSIVALKPLLRSIVTLAAEIYRNIWNISFQFDLKSLVSEKEKKRGQAPFSVRVSEGGM